MLIHDVDSPEIVIDILDFRLIAEQKKVPLPPREFRNKQAALYLKRYNTALMRFKHFGKEAVSYGAMEKRIFAVYSRSPVALSKLYKGLVKLRSQSGLRDEFETAVKRAEPYLPYMEDIFRSYKIPSELTRIAFVESMFNVQAKSKVGASGVWQFMPGTARKFLYVNSFIDERNSPLKATKAAAQLLSLNYQDLNSWPLAITAYNHGTGGMLRAVKKIGSSDISKIIEKYESPSFGFASKNFYAEFLAALKSFPKVAKNYSTSTIAPSYQLEVVTLDRPITVNELLKLTPIDRKTMELHNRCLLPRAYDLYANKKLPPYFQIFVPVHLAEKVNSSIQKIRSQRYAQRN